MLGKATGMNKVILIDKNVTWANVLLTDERIKTLHHWEMQVL